MRADRLVAILLLLQRRGQVTAAEVAAELEVSERTARRDLEALGQAGLPVYPQPGRGGGWRLLGGGRTDLSGLTSEEVRALFLVAGPSSGATPEVRAALRKLVRALPEPMRDEAESASAAVIVDSAAWGRRAWSAEPPHLNALQQAVVTGVRVRLGYAAPGKEASERVVDPLGLARKGQVWYLLAGTEAGQRTFRVSRVVSVELLAEAVERPDGFDLATAWQSVTDEVEKRRGTVQVEAIAERRYLAILAGLFGSHLTITDSTDPASQRVPITVSGHSLQALTGQLGGFGAGVTIVGPPAARRQLADLGRQLIELYAEADGPAVSGDPWDSAAQVDD